MSKVDSVEIRFCKFCRFVYPNRRSPDLTPRALPPTLSHLR